LKTFSRYPLPEKQTPRGELNNKVMNRLKLMSPVDVNSVHQQLLRYVPGAVRARTQFSNAAAVGNWLGEFRRVTVLFISVHDLPLTDIHMLQCCFRIIQQYIYLLEGALNKFLMDDKGVIAVCAFGIPPLQHPNDAALAVKAALMVIPALEKIGVKCVVGLASGRVYCGEVGSLIRREYTLLGAFVNLAARMMQVSILFFLKDCKIEALSCKKNKNKNKHTCLQSINFQHTESRDFQGEVSQPSKICLLKQKIMKCGRYSYFF
jgi:class 3 adenylate cyclase